MSGQVATCGRRTPLALVVERHPALAAAVALHIGGVQIVTLPASAAARSAGSSCSAAATRSPSPVSTACHCPSDNRRAKPAAVVAARSSTRGQLLTGPIGAVGGVRPDHEVFPGQLRGGVLDAVPETAHGQPLKIRAGDVRITSEAG